MIPSWAREKEMIKKKDCTSRPNLRRVVDVHHVDVGVDVAVFVASGSHTPVTRGDLIRAHREEVPVGDGVQSL